MIDRQVINDYLEIIDTKILDLKKYEIVELLTTDKTKFADIENSKLDERNDTDNYKDLIDMTMPELTNIIVKLKAKEALTNSNNGVKYYTIKRLEAERLLSQLQRHDS